MAEESKDVSRPTTGKVSGRDQPGILQQFTIDLLGAHVPHESKFFMLAGNRYKVMIMFQVPAANAEAVRASSELILDTLTVEGAY